MPGFQGLSTNYAIDKDSLGFCFFRVDFRLSFEKFYPSQLSSSVIGSALVLTFLVTFFDFLFLGLFLWTTMLLSLGAFRSSVKGAWSCSLINNIEVVVSSS